MSHFDNGFFKMREKHAYLFSFLIAHCWQIHINSSHFVFIAHHCTAISYQLRGRKHEIKMLLPK